MRLPAHPEPILVTDRLLLRQLELGDADFMLSLLNEPAFHRYIGDRGVRTCDDARAYLRDGAIDSYARHGHGLYLVALRECGTPIGICGLVRRAGLDVPDLGFALLSQWWAQGFAHEAASAVLHYAQHTLRHDVVAAIVSPNNVASMRLLERLGFRFERSLRLSPAASLVQLYLRESQPTRHSFESHSI